MSTDPSGLRVEQSKAAARILRDEVYKRFPWACGDGGGFALPTTTDPAQALINRTWRPTLSVTGVDGMPELGNAGNVLRPYVSRGSTVRERQRLRQNAERRTFGTLVRRLWIKVWLCTSANTLCTGCKLQRSCAQEKRRSAFAVDKKEGPEASPDRVFREGRDYFGTCSMSRQHGNSREACMVIASSDCICTRVLPWRTSAFAVSTRRRSPN